jgi:hypothetical protein
MHRYYFDLKHPHRCEPDTVGVSLEDITEVDQEALRGLADLLQERLIRSNFDDLTMEVRDGHGDVLIRISVTIRHDLLKP